MDNQYQLLPTIDYPFTHPIFLGYYSLIIIPHARYAINLVLYNIYFYACLASQGVFYTQATLCVAISCFCQ